MDENTEALHAAYPHTATLDSADRERISIRCPSGARVHVDLPGPISDDDLKHFENVLKAMRPGLVG